MTAENAKHIVLVPMIMWGHARPMCTLAARLVKLRDVVVTMFMSGAFAERVRAEIGKDFEPGEAAFLARITLVPLHQSNSPFDSASYEADFLDVWARFMGGEPLSGYAADGTPRAVDPSEKDRLSGAIIDMFAIRAFSALHGLKQKGGMKVFTWYPSTASSLFFWFGEDRVARAQELAARTHVSFNAAAHELMIVSKGELIESPCLPPMYDYEYHPQTVDFPPDFAGSVLIHVNRCLREADGMITIDAAEYHPPTAAVVRAWFAPRPAYYAGPLVPRSARALEGDGAPAEAEAELTRFLDARLESHGVKSVMLISYGSMFWPADSAKVGAVLDVLMDEGIPFVLSRCSPRSSIPDETARRLEAYGAAFVSKWVPQQAVLAHPATGWCLTHAGHNSVLECIIANVPMILWPIDADQTPNAIHLAEELRIAYELVEVRHGAGLGTVFRTGKRPRGTVKAVREEVRAVLARAQGRDGKEMRRRLGVVRERLCEAWEAGGVARREMEMFIDNL
ncbi:glycosyltransferase family 1 protein [Trametes coccinea BRFM310]|uniref:Glycosyltransferase family 1 protein n=1 Tax=Trametes coccinea (strain BRFM310) TaxID=1353009 RepID=A0A1Y2J2J7_TRAC3|nr:glycosyltransferase family 1 protein [Trametes coccinea BRFM310]